MKEINKCKVYNCDNSIYKGEVYCNDCNNIDSLEISIILYNILVKNNIITRRKIIRIGKKGLLKIKGIGREYLRELIDSEILKE